MSPDLLSNDTLLLAAAAVLAVLGLASVAMRRRGARTRAEPSEASAGDAAAASREAAQRRAELFADLPLDALIARMRPEPGPLAEAREHLRAGRAAQAKRVLEQPEAYFGWSAWPEHAWLLAKARLAEGAHARAVAAAREALAIPGLEMRDVAQGWAVLRELGEAPPADEAGRVLGAVAELEADRGPAAVAAYADGEARLVSSAGGGISTRAADVEAGEAAAEFVSASAGAVSEPIAQANAADRWPAAGRVRVTLLTPSGRRVAEDDEPRLRAPEHPLHAAFTAALRLLGLLRERMRPIARVTVTRGDEILLDERPVSLDALRAELARVKAADGAVTFHRLDPRSGPSPVGHEVFLAILDARLPLTISEEPADVEAPAEAELAPAAAG